jgi:hypothetical protein
MDPARRDVGRCDDDDHALKRVSQPGRGAHRPLAGADGREERTNLARRGWPHAGRSTAGEDAGDHAFTQVRTTGSDRLAALAEDGSRTCDSTGMGTRECTVY